jgi:hypothetical protein
LKLGRLSILLAALSISLAAPSVHAQSGKDDARRFFNAGQKAYKAGKYVEAAKAYEEAFRIKPHPSPLINAGDAWEKSGNVGQAARDYHRVLSLEQAGEQDRADATDRLAKIAPRVGIFELKGDSSARVRVDDDEFHGGDRVYVDPGSHTIILLDVDDAKEVKFDVAGGASRSVDLDSLKPKAENQDNGASTSGGVDTGATGEDLGPTKKGHVRPITIALLGLAAVGTGGAIYFGLQVNDAESKYNDHPNRDDLDRFNKNKLYTNVSIGVAAASAIAGTIFLVGDLNRKSPQKSEARRSLPLGLDFAPMPGGGFGQSSGRF